MQSLLRMFDRFHPHGAAILLAAVLPVLLVAPIATGILERFDYPVHRELAWNFAWPAHFLYHALLTLFRAGAGDWDLAQRLLLLANHAGLGLALYAFMSQSVQTKRRYPLLGLLAVSLSFVYVIPALFQMDGQFYFGYLALNVYHNTTSLLLKPIIVLHLLWLYLWLSGERHVGTGFLFIGALLVVLSALAKPSYLVILLPAVFLMVVRDQPAWRSALLAIVLPGVAVLAWLFLNTFGGGGGGLAFAPLKVMTHFTEPWTILPKTVLSLLFPLIMLAVLGRQVLADRLAVLCWLMLLLGLAYGLLLTETGERVFDGNWLWSGQLGAFALFVANTRLLLDNTRQSVSGWRLTLAWMVFSCHLVAGLAWYLLQYQADPTLFW